MAQCVPSLEHFLKGRCIIAFQRKAENFTRTKLQCALEEWLCISQCTKKELASAIRALGIYLGIGAYFGSAAEQDTHRRAPRRQLRGSEETCALEALPCRCVALRPALCRAVGPREESVAGGGGGPVAARRMRSSAACRLL